MRDEHHPLISNTFNGICLWTVATAVKRWLINL
jgi:hypothetical protein